MVKSKNPGHNKNVNKSKNKGKKNVVSQKRFVLALKVFVTPEEKAEVENKVGNFKSISNLIRHHLGLNPNEVGRRRKNILAAFNLSELETEDAPTRPTFDTLKAATMTKNKSSTPKESEEKTWQKSLFEI